MECFYYSKKTNENFIVVKFGHAPCKLKTPRGPIFHKKHFNMYICSNTPFK